MGEKHRKMQCFDLRICAICVVFAALTAAGCVILRSCNSEDHNADTGSTVRLVQLAVDWSKMPLCASYDKAYFDFGGLRLPGGFILSKVFPIQQEEAPWNFRKVRVVFEGNGEFNGTASSAIVQADVELMLTPSEKLQFHVSMVENVEITLFDAEGATISAETKEVSSGVEKLVGGMTFEIREYPGVAAEYVGDGKVWCHEDHVAFDIKE